MEGGHFYVLSLQGVCHELLHTMSADRYGHRAYRPHRSYRTSRPRRVRRAQPGRRVATGPTGPAGEAGLPGPTDPRALTDFPAPRGLRESRASRSYGRYRSQRFYGGQQALRGPRVRPGRRDPQAHRRDRGYAADGPYGGDREPGRKPYELFCAGGCGAGRRRKSAAPFQTIQQALAAAPPDSVIHVLRGTYPISQQLVISSPGLTIRGRAGAMILLQGSGGAVFMQRQRRHDRRASR